MAGMNIIRGRTWTIGKVEQGLIGQITEYKKDGENSDMTVKWFDEVTSFVTFPSVDKIHVLDTDSLGLRHPAKVCDSCPSGEVIRGFLWKCQDCVCILCSQCYHNKKHNLKHIFERVNNNGLPGVRVGRREHSKRVALQGPSSFKGKQYFVDHLPYPWELYELDLEIKDSDIYDYDQPISPSNTKGTKPSREDPTTAYVNVQSAEGSIYENQLQTKKKDNSKGKNELDKNPGMHYKNQPSSDQAIMYENYNQSDEKDTRVIPPMSPEDETYDELNDPFQTDQKEKTPNKLRGLFSRKTKEKGPKETTKADEKPGIAPEACYNELIRDDCNPADQIYDDLLEGSPQDPKKDDSQSPQSSLSVTIKKLFKAGRRDELTVRPGDMVTNVSYLDSEPGWLEGTLHGKRGMFPEQNAEIKKDATNRESTSNPMNNRRLPDLPCDAVNQAQQSQPAAESVSAEAMHKHRARDTDELNFEKGDIITDVCKIDAGWWVGKLNGRIGSFPANYVKEITDDKSKKKVETTGRRSIILDTRVTESRKSVVSDSRVTQPKQAAVPRVTEPKQAAASAKPSILRPKEPEKPKFAVGDNVKIIKDEATLMKLQEGRGIWDSTKYAETFDKVGRVADIHKSGDIFVKFESMYQRFNPNALVCGDAAKAKPIQRRLSAKLQGTLDQMVNRESQQPEEF